MTPTLFLAVGFGLITGAAVGACLYAGWMYRQAHQKLRLPSKWPLTSKALLTHDEHEIFKWLSSVFHDHLVMVKTPVLRFTAPVSKVKNGGGARWQNLLKDVYCTFIVCTANGHVVGCLDVSGKRGLNRTTRELKESLLLACNIGYTVIRGDDLPNAGSLRTAFLGELTFDDGQSTGMTRGGDSSFQADLDSFTKEKRQAVKVAALLKLNGHNDAKATLQPQRAAVDPARSGAPDLGKSNRTPQKSQDSLYPAK